ncbi:MAG TPA: CAP domain-containing protein [Actinomycetota bacterium]|jgi:uncharacterized protein YkwD
MLLLSDGRKLRGALALALTGLIVLGVGGVRTDADADERVGRRRQMLALTNEDREQRERDELAFAARLSRYAKRHSQAMADAGQIFHSDADDIRAALEGYRWSLAGENVGVGTTLDGLQSAFMHSKLHRENILRTTFEHAAVGVVRTNGHLWVTVIFYG